MLDGQAPDIEVVADGVDDVDDEAAVDADGEAQRAENERNLIDVGAERRRPPDHPQLLQKVRAHAVGYPERKRQRQHVVEGESRLRQVRHDDLAYAVCVDEADEEHEWHEMVVEDHRLQVEVGRDECPCGEEGQEAEHGNAGAFASGATGV